MRVPRRNLLRNLEPSKPDWTKPMKEVARDLGVSRATAYRLRDSYRRKSPKSRQKVDPQAELFWLLETLKRCHRVRRDAEKAFGPALKAWRKKRGMTQNDLAERVFQSENRIKDICGLELGDVKPSELFLSRLEGCLETMNQRTNTP